jgi:CubicO group peptidase (beta-lactamase class C family)
LRAQSKGLSPDKRAQIEKSLSSFMAVNSVPGISVAVVQDGELVWSQGFGSSSTPAASRAPARPSSSRRIVVPESSCSQTWIT